jgi:hypothetical protein
VKPAWLAVSTEPAATTTTTRFFQNRKAIELNAQAYDSAVQNAVLDRCLDLCQATPP